MTGTYSGRRRREAEAGEWNMTISVPGLKQPVGAGDLVKRAASTVGIKQSPDLPGAPVGSPGDKGGGCGCRERQAALNRRLQFVPRHAASPPAPVMVPQTAASQTNGNGWVTPPLPAPGWVELQGVEKERQGCSVLLFEHSISRSWLVWTVIAGEYRNSYRFSDRQSALDKLAEL